MTTNFGHPHAKRPLISICLLTYNQEMFIREAVESALSQTYSPLEIVLSDDCSIDSTFTIIQKIVEGYKGPHAIILNRNEKNLGLVPHINKVYCEIAHGELLVAAAGDDISVPKRVETLWHAWEATNRKATLLSSGATHISASGVAVSEWVPQTIGYDNRDIVEFILNPTGNLRGPAAMFHRKVFDTFGPLTIAQVEDGPLLIRSKMLGPVHALPDKLIKYRLSDNNMTASTDLDYKKKMTRGNIWRISIYDQVVDDINKGKVLGIFTKSIYGEIVSLCQSRRKTHEMLLRMISGSFFVRISLWLRLLFVVPIVQSLDNVVFLVPSRMYPKLMKYGLPTDSRLWAKILAARRKLMALWH